MNRVRHREIIRLLQTHIISKQQNQIWHLDGLYPKPSLLTTMVGEGTVRTTHRTWFSGRCTTPIPLKEPDTQVPQASQEAGLGGSKDFPHAKWCCPCSQGLRLFLIPTTPGAGPHTPGAPVNVDGAELLVPCILRCYWRSHLMARWMKWCLYTGAHPLFLYALSVCIHSLRSSFLKTFKNDSLTI